MLCYAGLGDAQASITQHNPLYTFFGARDLKVARLHSIELRYINIFNMFPIKSLPFHNNLITFAM